jgi:hypothetical protein
MPANTNYLLAAYGIVIFVVLLYGIGLTLKLKSITSKLNHLAKTRGNETKES